jgi:hypothetical protein
MNRRRHSRDQEVDARDHHCSRSDDRGERLKPRLQRWGSVQALHAEGELGAGSNATEPQNSTTFPPRSTFAGFFGRGLDETAIVPRWRGE